MNPWGQVHEYRHAITFASTLAEIDSTRIGVGHKPQWRHVLVVGAVDRRVKCVVAQCPTISGLRNALRRFPGDEMVKLPRKLEANRKAIFRGETPGMIPIAPDLNVIKN
jgi:cephalosporin-C deacetylase-like acetyl esterase